MPSWNWDESASESGVVHQSTTNTDHDDATVLKQGYDYAAFSEITPDPVAYWPHHEDSGSTLNDVSNANDGTINGATVGQTGILGSTSFSYDGTDDYCDIPNSLHDFTTAYAVSAFVNPSRTGTFEQVASFKGEWNTQLSFTENDRFQIQHYDGSNSHRATSNQKSTGSWYFVVGTYNGSGRMRIYIDGTRENEITSANDPTSQANNSYIATDPGGSYIQANMAEIGVWTTELSGTQVQTLNDVVHSVGSWTSTVKTL